MWFRRPSSPLQHLYLLLAFAACTSAEQPTDPFDDPLDLVATDSVRMDLHGVDPTSFTRTPVPFSCGTAELIKAQQAYMDSVIRAGGGVMCYDTELFR